jgi:hypothetical protein
VFVSHYVRVATEEVVKTQPELVRSSVRALLDAEKFYRSDNTTAVADVALRLKATNEVTKKSLETVNVGVRLDESLLDDLVLNGKWAVEAGLARQPEQDLRALYRSLIYPDAMRAVAPDRVALK